MTSRILIIGAADGAFSIATGNWLVNCNVDTHDGGGSIETTHDRSRAMAFADFGAAMEYYRRRSTVRPTRPDGKPNRPLTAYTIEVVKDGVEPML